MRSHSRTILKKLPAIPSRIIYVLAIVLVVFGGIVWWRPGHASATTDTFTTSGTWTVPAGVTSADFEAWGAGGEGGDSSTSNSGGGGGAGGQYSKTTLSGLVSSDNYTVTVATTTTGGSGNGLTGGDSSVTSPSSSTVVLAKGGAGGGTNGGAGGSGSTAGGVGDNVYAGGSGAAGGSSSGAGGGGAGSGGAGGNASGTTAGSGTATNGGNGGAGVSAKSAGNAGSIYGAGGSGGLKTNGPTQQGGNGAQGLVTVTYTPAPTNSSPNAPSLTSPTDGTTINSTTPALQLNATDPDSDDIQYIINLYQTDCSTTPVTFDQSANGSGWDNGTTAYTSGTTATYTLQFALNRGGVYCWNAQAKDPGGTNSYGTISADHFFTVDDVPSTPTLTAPSSGATGVSTTPTFTSSDTDPDSDDIQFTINLFQSNCTTSVTTYAMSSGQTGWSPTFDGTAGSGLTYLSSTAGTSPYISFTPSSALSNSTTYCWSVSAKDPGGSNTTTTSSTQSFTTAAAGGTEQLNIGGGVNITGGTNVY